MMLRERSYRLVHLLESPVFAYLRLQLLQPRLYPELLHTLYGLLMLLPQTDAFNKLSRRLSAVPTDVFLNLVRRIPGIASHSNHFQLADYAPDMLVERRRTRARQTQRPDQKISGYIHSFPKILCLRNSGAITTLALLVCYPFGKW